MSTLEFNDVYRFFRVLGSIVIPYRTAGADSIEVWASKLMSGARKGQEVLRIQWQRSSSTVGDEQWGYPDSSSEKRVKKALEQTLKHSPFIAQRIADGLNSPELPLEEKAFLLHFQNTLREFDPGT